MSYVLVTLGGVLVGHAAADLWRNGFSMDKISTGFVGLVLAVWGFQI